jgi:hypothetical protein
VGPLHEYKCHGKPLIDYNKFIILIHEGYINMMEKKKCWKEKIATEKEKRQLEALKKKSEQELQKIQKEAEKQQRAANAKAKVEFKARRTTPTCAQARQELHDQIKANSPCSP